MPYTKSTVPDYVPAGKAKKWADIWNSAYDYAKGKDKTDADAEKYAFAVANSKALGEGKNGANMERELRFSTEIRAVGGTSDADPLALAGYAAKFNSYSQDLGGFKERIKPGAFKRALAEGQDIRCLMNHDPNLVLGRSKNKTLTLTEDATGLAFRVELPNTQLARDLHTSISRGDIDQCSFAFKVPSGGDNWGEDKDENGNFFASRELNDVDLFDVSAVTYPAYLDTNVSARECVPAEIRSMVEKKNAERLNPPVEEVRAELKNENDPDNDGDDDSVLVNALKAVNEACMGPINAASDAASELNQDQLVDFVTKAQVAVKVLNDAVEAATAELSEGANAAPGAGEVRNPDPAATRPHMEGVSMPAPSNKVMLAEADAKLATAHAALKSAKVAHVKAKEEAAQAADDTKADANAKVAVAKAAVKTAKAAHMKASEEHVALKASMASGSAGENPVDGFDPDIQECACRHCRSGMLDRDDSEDGPDDDSDCTDPSCDCQNRWSVTGDEGGGGPRSLQPGEEGRADKIRTKRVGGKDLTADKFAFVGDPDRTETWKLPIHDKSHVQNALSRFGQTQGIPADKKSGVWRKIKAAAAKFGIEVSKEQNSLALVNVAPDEHERLFMRARLNSFDIE